jgi:hypothetical protein
VEVLEGWVPKLTEPNHNPPLARVNTHRFARSVVEMFSVGRTHPRRDNPPGVNPETGIETTVNKPTERILYA